MSIKSKPISQVIDDCFKAIDDARKGVAYYDKGYDAGHAAGYASGYASAHLDELASRKLTCWDRIRKWFVGWI